MAWNISPAQRAMNIDDVRRQLLSRREELRHRAARVSADQRRENDPLSPDFADQATQRENDAVLEAIGESTGQELGLIDAALRRLESGQYGVCVVCGEQIEIARLALVPHTDRCSGCAGQENR